jgi:hypothetical protein
MARARYRRDAAAAAGIPQRVASVDSTAAAVRIRGWLADGLSLRDIARRTGCGRATIAVLAKSDPVEPVRVLPETLRRVMSVELLP